METEVVEITYTQNTFHTYLKSVFCISNHLHIDWYCFKDNFIEKQMNAISFLSLQLKNYYQIFINIVWPPFRLYKSCPFEDDVYSLHTVFPLSEPHSISRVRGVTEANSVSSKITFRPSFPFPPVPYSWLRGGSWVGRRRRRKSENLNVMPFFQVSRHSWSFSVIH